MMHSFGNRFFEFVLAGNIQADQESLEVWETDGSEPSNLVAEVIRQDPVGSLFFSSYSQQLPFDLVETLAGMAREKLLYEGWNAYQQMGQSK